MPDKDNHKDIQALDHYQLIPRVLHNIHEVSTSTIILEQTLAAPILPYLEKIQADKHPMPQLNTLSLVDADVLLSQNETDFKYAIPLLKTAAMGELIPKVRKLSARSVAALILDFSPLAKTPPFGSHIWKPKTREDLAELRAAAGCPLWIKGISSPHDAEIATEASLEGIIVSSALNHYLGGPATIEIFPEIFDAVAGMISVYAGGAIRNGIDIFRYLAVGAEAVVINSDRNPNHLRAELEYAMRITGCETLADISYEAIFSPLFEEL